jgi:hypothetical protein
MNPVERSECVARIERSEIRERQFSPERNPWISLRSVRATVAALAPKASQTFKFKVFPGPAVRPVTTVRSTAPRSVAAKSA